jgi:hypothetical protein
LFLIALAATPISARTPVWVDFVAALHHEWLRMLCQLMRIRQHTGNAGPLEQYQDRYTHGAHSSVMLKFSGEVIAT